MLKNSSFFISFILLLSSVNSTSAAFVADTNWTGNLSSDWNTISNWDNGIPTGTKKAIIDDTGSYSLVISTGTSAAADSLQFGYGTSSTSNPTITAGSSLSLANFLTMAQGSNSNVTFTMSGGVLDAEGNISVGYAGTAVLNMTNGTIYIGPPAGGKSLRIGVSSGSSGRVNLHGGLINTTGLSMRESGGIGTMDITTGTLIITGQWSPSSNYFKDGWITAYGGSGTLNFNYNPATNKTTITASTSTSASKPNPANGAQGVPRNTILSWTPAAGATSHDVYLGTNYNDVNDANNPNIIPGRGRQDANSFNPAGLVPGQIYYWRIDELFGISVTKGVLWSFTVDSGVAKNPNPADGSIRVNPNTVLNWSAGDGAVSHNVYLGTNFNDVNQSTNPTATTNVNSYDPCNLGFNQTYYWRIDEFDGVVTYKGSVWNFTTDTAVNAPAFPDAEGAGKWTIGGRGGTVYEVTNLNDSGTGSLRAAVQASGPRIVVFRVSGTIALQSHLTINNPYITIAGQTAPGDGICLKDYALVVHADEVIIRFLRVRTADNAGAGFDTISVGDGHNIIIDHCSASWGVDETLSTSTNTAGLDNVTVQWCLITESLNCSNHPEGCHGYGTLAKGGWGCEYTYHHNLYAHHSGRSPYPGNYQDITVDPEGLTFDFRNNVIYNWGGSFAGYNTQAGANSVTRMNFLGNYYKAGFNSTGTFAFYQAVTNSRGYFRDNWMNTGYPADAWSLVKFGSGWTTAQINAYKQASPIPVSEPVTMDDAETAYVRVLAEAGATLPVRDSVDERVINSVINRTGSIINDEDEVGSWPVLHSATPPADSDHDGMPDKWELARGLNPNNAADSAADRNGDGYTNVEEYLNYLVVRGSAPLGNFDDDGDVDIEDLAIFAQNWLKSDCDNIPAGNLNYDCDVDFEDFAILANNWLEGI